MRCWMMLLRYGLDIVQQWLWLSQSDEMMILDWVGCRPPATLAQVVDLGWAEAHKERLPTWDLLLSNALTFLQLLTWTAVNVVWGCFGDAFVGRYCNQPERTHDRFHVSGLASRFFDPLVPTNKQVFVTVVQLQMEKTYFMVPYRNGNNSQSEWLGMWPELTTAVAMEGLSRWLGCLASGTVYHQRRQIGCGFFLGVSMPTL